MGDATGADRSGAQGFRRRWEHLNGPRRIAGIDFARGLAVIGMLAAHLLWIGDRVVFAEPATWAGVVNGRSSILFATLAGVSLGLMTGGRSRYTGSRLAVARGRIAMRAAILWVLGMLLIATGVPVYVILPAYAVLFVLAVPLLGLSAPALFAIAAGTAVVMPFVQVILDSLPAWSTELGASVAVAVGWNYPFPVWIAFVLAGLGISRLGVDRPRVQFGAVAIGGALAALGYGLDAFSGADESAEWTSYGGALWTARPHSSGLLEVIGSGGFALAVIGACLLLCRPWWPASRLSPLGWATLPIRAVGAMPLTAYTVQLLIWAVAAAVLLGDTSDLGGFRDLDPFLPVTAVVVVAATAWSLCVGRGPLEAMSDRITRLVVPARNEATGAPR